MQFPFLSVGNAPDGDFFLPGKFAGGPSNRKEKLWIARGIYDMIDEGNQICFQMKKRRARRAAGTEEEKRCLMLWLWEKS